MSLGTRVRFFAMVGSLCFMVQWLIVHALRYRFLPFPADMLGFAASAQLNFWLSNTITWNDRRDQAKRRLLAKWGSYNLVAVSAMFINATVFWLLFGRGEIFALVCAIGASSCFTFMVNDSVVFRGRHPVISSEKEYASSSTRPYGTVAVFMPAYNEAANLVTVLPDLHAALTQLGVSFSIIVVDDGSTDDTANVVVRMRSIHDNIELVQHAVNLKYGAALRTGFQEALATGHDWIGFCDSDGQFDPHDFGRLIEAAQASRSDACFGYRIKRADGTMRLLMGRGWNLVSQAVLTTLPPAGAKPKVNFIARDVDCGIKIFRREALMALDPSRFKGGYATVSPEIVMRARCAGLKVAELGVVHRPRRHGEQTGANLRTIVGSFRDLIALRASLSDELRPALRPESESA